MQTTSEDKGIPFLEAHEGVVLTAYRCPAGKWTIGAGLTAASGVVVPHAGMAMTRAEASRLLKLALARYYEPAVRQALGPVPQNAFDGAVSFHFNTGAIGRASWVGSYRANDSTGVRSRLALWNKGGGRVLPGLQRRRREEADAILLDRWPNDLRVASVAAPSDPQFASFVISVTSLEIAEIRDAFREVGFEPGATVGKVDRQVVLAFQRHYGLTVDGLIGKQTLSALQRELDARRKSTRGGAGAAAPLLPAATRRWRPRLRWSLASSATHGSPPSASRSPRSPFSSSHISPGITATSSPRASRASRPGSPAGCFRSESQQGES
jgi:lysozyme